MSCPPKFWCAECPHLSRFEKGPLCWLSLTPRVVQTASGFPGRIRSRVGLSGTPPGAQRCKRFSSDRPISPVLSNTNHPFRSECDFEQCPADHGLSASLTNRHGARPKIRCAGCPTRAKFWCATPKTCPRNLFLLPTCMEIVEVRVRQPEGESVC